MIRSNVSRVAWWVGVCCLAFLLPAVSQAQEAVGQQVLQERTVLLSIGHLLVEGECLGFRLYREEFPPDVDLVLTAAHCILGKGDQPTVIVEALSKAKRGTARAWLTWEEYDVALLLVTPKLGDLTPISNVWRQPPSGLPILALIRVGGGKPTPASGRVIQQEGSLLRLLLPAAPGTSGGGVVDFLTGYPVGLIVRTNMYVRQSAGFMTEAVGMDLIVRLLDQQRGVLTQKARELSPLFRTAQSRVVASKSNLRKLVIALESYFVDNGQYPTSLREMVPAYLPAFFIGADPQIDPCTHSPYDYSPIGTPPTTYRLTATFPASNACSSVVPGLSYTPENGPQETP
jgi:hypothetical protein